MGDRFNTFTTRAKRALVLAQTEALRLRHTHIGTEHLLLGLTSQEESAAARVLTNLGVARLQVRRAVAGVVDPSRLRISGTLRLTPRAKRVIELAVEEASHLHHPHIGTEHLLLGLLREGEGIAAGVLQRLGVTLELVRAPLRREDTPPTGSGA